MNPVSYSLFSKKNKYRKTYAVAPDPSEDPGLLPYLPKAQKPKKSMKTKLKNFFGPVRYHNVKEIKEPDPVLINQDQLKEYLSMVDRLKGHLQSLKSNMKDMNEKHHASLECISTLATNLRRQELDDLTNQTDRIIKAIRLILQELDPVGDDNHFEMKRNMHLFWSRKFMELLREYRTQQERCKEKYWERVHRQLKIIKPDSSREDVDKIIRLGADKSVFANQLLTTRSTQAAKNALADIYDKHDEILR